MNYKVYIVWLNKILHMVERKRALSLYLLIWRILQWFDIRGKLQYIVHGQNEEILALNCHSQ